MKKVCDHCGAVIGGVEYDLSIAAPMKYEHYNTCSEECLKNILHKRVIATYPTVNKLSLKLSQIAVIISVIAIIIQIIRTITVIL